MMLSAVRATLARYNCPPTLFLSAFALVLLTYAYQAVVPAFNADDIIQVQSPDDANSFLAKLRWGYYLIYATLLGSNPAPLFTTVLGTLLMVVSAFMAATILDIRSQLAAFVFVLISSISVYYGDLFGFDSTRLVYPVGNLVAVHGLLRVLSGRHLSGIVLIALACSFYSASVELAATILVASTIDRLTREAWLPVLYDFFVAAAAMLAALVLFFGASKFLLWMLGLTFALENIDYLDAFAIAARFDEILGILQYHALPILAAPGLAYLPVTVAWCATLLFLLYLMHSTTHALGGRGAVNAALVLIFSAGLLVTPFFLILANSNAVFSTRSFFSFSMIHGFWAAKLLDHYAPKPFVEPLPRLATAAVLVLSSLIVLSSATWVSKRALEEYLVSQADLMITNRIIARIETLLAETPDAPVDPIPLAVIFQRPILGGPVGGLGSARSLPWAREWIFRLVDRRFEWVTGERYGEAFEAAKSHGDWPAKGAVFMHNGAVVVVINKQ